MKRLLATLLMALTLFCAISAAAFAANESKIVISNNIKQTGITLQGKTFNVYQIFSGVVADGGITYTLNEEYKQFFTDKGVDEGDEADYIHEQYDAHAMATLVKELDEYVSTNGIGYDSVVPSQVQTVNGVENVKSELLAPGYYLVLDETNIDENSHAASAGMLVSLPTKDTEGEFTGDGTINLKGSQPGIDKEIMHNDKGDWDDVGDHQIGDVVQFRIKADIPADITGYTEYTYIITDTWSDGIDFNGNADDIKIYLDKNLTQEVAGANHEILNFDKENRTFSIKFNMIGIKDLLPDLQEFYIAYEGTINDNAEVAAGYEENKVELEFSNDPYGNSIGKVEDTVYSYTFELDVLKVNTAGEALAGAKFGLFVKPHDEKPEYQVFLKQDETDPTTYIVQAGGDFTASENAGCVVTGQNGKFQIKGLDDEITYVLRELEAPMDYSKAEDVIFTITANHANGTVDVTATGGVTDADDDRILETTVINTSIKLFPGTGGIGSTIFMFGGCAIMAFAAFMLISSRKRHN